jgi:signal transduction histidine kinase
MDDGDGFDHLPVKIEPSSDSGLGLWGMQERLDLLKGHLKIERRTGGGTHLIAQVPRRKTR